MWALQCGPGLYQLSLSTWCREEGRRWLDISRIIEDIQFVRQKENGNLVMWKADCGQVVLNRNRLLICRSPFSPHQLPSCLITTAVVPPLSAWCRGERKSYLIRCRRGCSSTRSLLQAQMGGNNREKRCLSLPCASVWFCFNKTKAYIIPPHQLTVPAWTGRSVCRVTQQMSVCLHCRQRRWMKPYQYASICWAADACIMQHVKSPLKVLEQFFCFCYTLKTFGFEEDDENMMIRISAYISWYFYLRV